MKIYVGHSSSLDFKQELYRPLRKSKIDEKHDIVLPHEDSDKLFDSKRHLRTECDLMVAEVSYPSIGLGIELGWADQFGVSVLCVYKEGSEVSSSLKAISEDIVSYTDVRDLVRIVGEYVEE